MIYIMPLRSWDHVSTMRHPFINSHPCHGHFTTCFSGGTHQTGIARPSCQLDLDFATVHWNSTSIGEPRREGGSHGFWGNPVSVWWGLPPLLSDMSLRSSCHLGPRSFLRACRMGIGTPRLDITSSNISLTMNPFAACQYTGTYVLLLMAYMG